MMLLLLGDCCGSVDLLSLCVCWNGSLCSLMVEVCGVGGCSSWMDSRVEL